MLTVYTKNNCPFCDRAKALLESKGVPYKAINVQDDPSSKDFLMEQGLRSVPQIFDGTTLLPGGFQGLDSKPAEFFEQYKG
jgi:glutaredoxin 3